jgi:hypothetical protein
MFVWADRRDWRGLRAVLAELYRFDIGTSAGA